MSGVVTSAIYRYTGRAYTWRYFGRYSFHGAINAHAIQCVTVIQCMSVCLCVCHKFVILCIRSQSYRNSFSTFCGGGATRPSTNFFSYLNEIRYVGLVCALYTMVWRMTRSKVKIKVKVTEVRKLQNWLIPKSIASAGMHIQGRIQGRGLAPGPYLPTLICDGIFGCFAIFFFKNIKI